MSLAHEVMPPAAMKALRSIKHATFGEKHELFAGNGEMFKRIVGNCRIYGEYGVGASTNWVYENTTAHIIANDTSPEWVATVLEGKDRSRIDLTLIDVGPVGEWGRPLNYDNRENFKPYCESIWRKDLKPEVVLVDGRFRVCCFLTSVLEGGEGLTIIFDDYAERPYYHIVEEVLPIRERCGRQALFQVDSSVDRKKVEALRDAFVFVMD